MASNLIHKLAVRAAVAIHGRFGTGMKSLSALGQKVEELEELLGEPVRKEPFCSGEILAFHATGMLLMAAIEAGKSVALLFYRGDDLRFYPNEADAMLAASACGSEWKPEKYPPPNCREWRRADDLARAHQTQGMFLIFDRRAEKTFVAALLAEL